MAGIKELREVFLAGTASGDVLVEAAADGKFGVTDAFLLPKLYEPYKNAFEGVSEVPAEFLDLDLEEAKELLSLAYQGYAKFAKALAQLSKGV